MVAMLQTTFQNVFSCMKIVLFRSNVTEIYSQETNWQYASIRPKRRHAIIWTDNGQFIDAYMRQSVSMS